jgi:hypothetical protein
MLVVELRERTVLRVAGACVDDDTEVSGFDDKGRESSSGTGRRHHELGHQPGLRGNVFACGFDEEVDPKDTTCSTTRVIRTPSTSHDIARRYSRGRVEAVQTDPAVLA